MHTLLVGLDAFDPAIVARLQAENRLPNLQQLASAGGYDQFAVSTPPQSEVSWTCIASGHDPIEHGLFDFVHRTPANYGLTLSLLPTAQKAGGVQFVPPFHLNTIFDQAAADGYQSTALWWPGMFPARQGSPVRSIPGLGTPDLLGRWGVGEFFSNDEDRQSQAGKIPVDLLVEKSKGLWQGAFKGPKRQGKAPFTSSFELRICADDSAEISTSRGKHNLHSGQWSPIIELEFKAGLFTSIKCITKLLFTVKGSEVTLFALPLQLHPLSPLWPYASPKRYAKRLWKQQGAWLTAGWPQDTTAYEEGYLTAEQFNLLCESIWQQRERILLSELPGFSEGLLGCIFDTLDRIQHMFWRDRPDIVESWYERMDGTIGRILKQARPNTNIVVVSDHGFADFDQKVHLNRWLIDNGQMVTRGNSAEKDLSQVNWESTSAYAIGLNSLCLNLAGREGKGIIPAHERDHKLDALSEALTSWRDSRGQAVVKSVTRLPENANIPHMPDAIIGYHTGFRASSETATGGWQTDALEANNDKWSGDHCIDASSVPGVLFSNRSLRDFPNPSYHDIPLLTIGRMPKQKAGLPTHATPPSQSGEDDDTLNERLRSLGYLS